jgi:hypothetical protein
VAKAELVKLEHRLMEEKRQREKELSDRRALVQQKACALSPARPPARPPPLPSPPLSSPCRSPLSVLLSCTPLLPLLPRSSTPRLDAVPPTQYGAGRGALRPPSPMGKLTPPPQLIQKIGSARADIDDQKHFCYGRS